MGCYLLSTVVVSTYILTAANMNIFQQFELVKHTDESVYFYLYFTS